MSGLINLQQSTEKNSNSMTNNSPTSESNPHASDKIVDESNEKNKDIPTLRESNKIGRKLAPYNPTNNDAVEMALKLLNISDSDILFDLGCGDGRVVIQAFSEYKCRGVGVEYDSDLCEKAVLKMKDVEDCCEYVTIVHNSVENIDFSEATVLFIYLVPEGIKAIRDKLIRALDRGVRIVTYVFSIPGLTPREVVLYKKSTKFHLYSGKAEVPEEKIDSGNTAPVSESSV